jgi:microcystin-dependent protein
MADPYYGEIRMFAGNFAPAGWMFCEGQLLPISQYDTLFNLIGTMYGGDGQSTFALPDLRGRIPMHVGNGHIQAEQGGTETVTLTVNQIPNHNHALLATSAVGTQSSPAGNYYAASGVQLYADPAVASPIAMKAGLGGPAGGSQPHNNFAPYLCVDFIICVSVGTYPSPT